LGVSFDRIAEIYDETRGLPLDVMEDVLAALSKELDKERLVLDAGVGTGRYAQPLQAKGYRVVGLDISKKMLAKAKAKGTSDIIRGNLSSLPFPDDTFDVCLSVHVLHLISDWRKALEEIGRVTTGKFVSVATSHEESPAHAVRLAYEKACEELGFSTRHPGMRERELPEILEPDIIKQIAAHGHPTPVPFLINEFQNRIFSSLWRVPEEIHQQAMQAIKEEFDGVDTLLDTEEISLIVWRAEKIRSLSR
jgi:ubiquinone/menaquinone biosynthesis C-methylase UbiE